MLWDQVKVEGVLLQECLTEVVPSPDHGHVKGSEPLERGVNQILLEYADQEPIVSLKLSKVSAVRLEM